MYAQLKCTTLWKVRKARKMCIFQQKVVDPQLVAEEVLDSVLEFNRKNPGLKSIVIHGQNSIKVHVAKEVCVLQADDGCLDDAFTTFGCFFEDHGGTSVFASCRKKSFYVDPVTTKTLAIRWSRQVAKHLRNERILIQSYSLNMVDCINYLKSIVGLDYLVIHYQLLLRSFKSASIMYFSRVFNGDAHNLVGLVKLFGSRIWLDSPLALASISIVPFMTV